jgi:hypothetical protein
MEFDSLIKLVDEGNTVTFYYAHDESKDRKYVAEISKSDEEIFVFASTMLLLLAKLERKEIRT